jgi:hypothetical protein
LQNIIESSDGSHIETLYYNILNEAISTVKKKIAYDGNEIKWYIFRKKYFNTPEALLADKVELGHYNFPDKVYISTGVIKKAKYEDYLIKKSPLIKNSVDDILADVLLQAFAHIKTGKVDGFEYTNQLKIYRELWNK